MGKQCASVNPRPIKTSKLLKCVYKYAKFEKFIFLVLWICILIASYSSIHHASSFQGVVKYISSWLPNIQFNETLVRIFGVCWMRMNFVGGWRNWQNNSKQKRLLSTKNNKPEQRFTHYFLLLPNNMPCNDEYRYLMLNNIRFLPLWQSFGRKRQMYNNCLRIIFFFVCPIKFIFSYSQMSLMATNICLRGSLLHSLLFHWKLLLFVVNENFSHFVHTLLKELIANTYELLKHFCYAHELR